MMSFKPHGTRPLQALEDEFLTSLHDAVAQTAFGLHFLSDAFSSGHMRTPRVVLGREGSLLAGIMHDFDNQLGLAVENQLGRRWRAFGDGYLEADGRKQRSQSAFAGPDRALDLAQQAACLCEAPRRRGAEFRGGEA